MKVLIIEDDLIVANYLKSMLKKHTFEVVAISDDVQSATISLEQNPDACLLDIRLADDNNGIEFGKILQEKKIPFIYLTANNEIATIKEAVATQPNAYLTKPFSERDVIAALELIKATIQQQAFIEVKTQKGKIKLLLSDILYCQADNVYTKIVIEDKEYVERVTLKDMENHLNENFIRVHRSYIVNKNKITSYKINEIFIGETKIPLSKNYKQELRKN